VLHNQLSPFENIKIEWVPGARPTAYLYDSNDVEIENFELGDRSLEELLKILSEHGFTAARPVITYPENPDAVTSYKGRLYELFTIPNFFTNANDFARQRTRDGLTGYTLTITSDRENAFITKLLTDNGVEKVWLGGTDEEEEGQWKWVGGADESGTVFWTSDHLGTEDETYVNWREGEPNDVNDEDCSVFYMSDGKWNDVLCLSDKAALVVEFGDIPLEKELEEQKVEEKVVEKEEEKIDL